MSFQQILPVVSNVFFFIPGFKAVAFDHWTRAIIYFLIPFTSGAFHLCDEMNICALDFIYLKNLDYLFALWIVPLTNLYFVHWGDTWAPLERLLIALYGVGLYAGIAKSTSSNDMLGQMLVAGTSFLIPLIYWIAYFANRVLENPKRSPCVNCFTAEYEAVARREGRYFPKYEWGYMLCGVGMTGIGVFLFTLQSNINPADGWQVHALWHMCAALGQYYILGIKAPPILGSYRVLDTQYFQEETRPLVAFLESKHPKLLRYSSDSKYSNTEYSNIEYPDSQIGGSESTIPIISIESLRYWAIDNSDLLLANLGKPLKIQITMK